MYSRNWEKAIKYLEKLEARYPYGRFAQQAQLDVAYAYWKSGERASAVAAADRFIKLYPNHTNVDYAWYLKGLVNFNENQGIFAVFDNPDMTERDPKGSYARSSRSRKSSRGSRSRNMPRMPRRGCVSSSIRSRRTKCTWRATT
jgi:outer membrane protein assembly factor BamD